MAKFSVGQRVKVVAVDPDAARCEFDVIGLQGQIIGGPAEGPRGDWFRWKVELDGAGGTWLFNSEHLAPPSPLPKSLLGQPNVSAR